TPRGSPDRASGRLAASPAASLASLAIARECRNRRLLRHRRGWRRARRCRIIGRRATGQGKALPGTRDGAIRRIEAYFDDGGFLADLARRVAIPTTSQEPDAMPALRRYLAEEMAPSLERLGYACEIHDNPQAQYGPFLIARRMEDAAL